MNYKKLKRIIIVCVIMFAIAILFFFCPRSIADYLLDDPLVLRLFALATPGASFTEVNVSNMRYIYDELIKIKIQPLLNFENSFTPNYFSRYARYSIRIQFYDCNSNTNRISYDIEYYPDVKTVQVFRNTKCVVTGKILEMEKVEHLLPSFLRSSMLYATKTLC